MRPDRFRWPPRVRQLLAVASLTVAAIASVSESMAQPVPTTSRAVRPQTSEPPLAVWAERAVGGGLPAPVSRTPGMLGRDAIAPADSGRLRPAPWWAPLASVLLPGAGQAVLGQTRAAAYAALDVYTLLQYREATRDATRAAARFRSIARDNARRLPGMPPDAALPDGDWSYYERLEKGCEIFAVVCVSSGAYDREPGGTFAPEIDPATYNGQIWALARRTFWRNPEVPPATDSPEYARALAFYRQRAEQPAYLWSWRDRQLQFDQYRQTIAQSNAAARTARAALGVMLANRVFSLVDGYATVRVRRFGPGGPNAITVTMPWPDAGTRR
jgi:hypothetical protein